MGRVLGSQTALNNSVLAFGNIPQPLLLCYANRTQEPLADFLVVSIPENICSLNIAADERDVQPGRFKMTVSVNVSGQHRVYIAGSNCTTGTASAEFDVNCKLSRGVHNYVTDNVVMVMPLVPLQLMFHQGKNQVSMSMPLSDCFFVCIISLSA